MNELVKVIMLPVRIVQRGIRYIFMWRMRRALSKSVEDQIAKRRILRRDIDVFLKEYFGLNGRSKFIPADFKNSEEVRVATIEKFGLRMAACSLNYTDLFKN